MKILLYCLLVLPVACLPGFAHAGQGMPGFAHAGQGMPGLKDNYIGSKSKRGPSAFLRQFTYKSMNESSEKFQQRLEASLDKIGHYERDYIIRTFYENCRRKDLAGHFGVMVRRGWYMGHLSAALENGAPFDLVKTLVEGGIPIVSIVANWQFYDDSPKVLRLLLDHGAPADAPLTSPSGRGQQTPLVSLIADGRKGSGGGVYLPVEMVRMLLDAGADPNRANGNDVRPLEAAVRKGRQDICTLLLERGADPRHGRLLSIGAVSSPDMLRFLLQSGLDAKGEEGAAALQDAAAGGTKEQVALLLEAGADVNVRDRHGRTALDVIRARRDVPLLTKSGKGIEELLLRAGAKSGKD